MSLYVAKTNPLLSQVMKLVRAGAPVVSADQRFSVRLDRACGGNFAQVWFLTRGCTWDRSGTCTMCNYGHGPAVTEDAMVESVQDALATIREPVDELFVSPSGSMLDPVEVPPRARLRIFDCLASFRAPKVCVETRAETVTPEAVEGLATILAAKKVTVEMGFESCSPWIREFCINKVCDPGSFSGAAELLARRGIRASANVSLGSAFLTAAEAIEDARSTVQWVLGHGADLAVVFPMHLKPHTLLAWLHQRGRYRPPSLWSLIEVLTRLEPEILPRVTISWYRSNYGSAEQSFLSPTTCTRCRARVLALLDRFREQPSLSTLTDLKSEECECKALWRGEVSILPHEGLPERVLHQYDSLAHDFGLSECWAAHRAGIRAAALGSSPLSSTGLVR